MQVAPLMLDQYNRYHITEGDAFVVTDASGAEVKIGPGWLAITEEEYRHLGGDPSPEYREPYRRIEVDVTDIAGFRRVVETGLETLQHRRKNLNDVKPDRDKTNIAGVPVTERDICAMIVRIDEDIKSAKALLEKLAP